MSSLACLMKISRRRDCPKGLYLRLKRSKRWKVFLSACMSSVSTFRSYLQQRFASMSFYMTAHPRILVEVGRMRMYSESRDSELKLIQTHEKGLSPCSA